MRVEGWWAHIMQHTKAAEGLSTMITFQNNWNEQKCVWCLLIAVIGDWYYINGLMQERRNSIANALELCLSCINPVNYLMYHLPTQLLISFHMKIFTRFEDEELSWDINYFTVSYQNLHDWTEVNHDVFK